MLRLYTIVVLAMGLLALAATSVFIGEPRILLFVLILLPTVIAGALLMRYGADEPPVRTRSLSPENITGYRISEPILSPAEQSPRELSRSIVERSEEIRRALSQSSLSDIQVEMCAIGYRSCVNDMITLTHKINAALSEAGFVGGMRLRADRRRATDNLAKTRQALPPGALRATRQELQ